MLSQELLELAWSRWNILRGAARILSSSVNLNVLVRSASGVPLVIRVYRTYTTEARLRDIQQVRNTLRLRGLPCADLVPTTDGQTIAALGGHLVEVEQYVEHSGHMNTRARLEQGLRMLGRMHTLMADIEVGPAGRSTSVANYIPPDEVMAGVAAGTARIRRCSTTVEEERIADAADLLAEKIEKGGGLLVDGQLRQIVHGDYWDNNVLFRGEDLVLIGDFDFMAERSRVDDLALTLYFSDSESALAGGTDRISILQPLVRAYVQTLDKPLTEAERAALPWAIARQPLWGIGGWVRRLQDDREAMRHARATGSSVMRALDLVTQMDQWRAGLFA